MRKGIMMLLCVVFITKGLSQTDQLGVQFAHSEIERTPEIEQLYAQAKLLENNGTAQEIEANRLALKAAWGEVDSRVANLYKPVHTGEQYNIAGYNGTPYVPAEIVPRPQISPTRDWTTDSLLRDDFIDGVDMEVAANGDIYIAAYENEIDAGGTVDHLYIYKSTDDGASFTLWKDEPAVSPFRKIELVLISGVGDEYLIAYSLFEGGLFQALRWDLPTASLSLESIVMNDATDFSVDRNYPNTTANQRVFASYQRGNPMAQVYSARSSAGSYGFGWVDEVSTSNTLGTQIDFAYGRNGATYIAYTGANTGNLYANVNNDFNDPASWGARETVELGTNEETANPSIIAARKLIPADEVLIFTSSIPTGSPQGYNIRYYIRENASAYSVLWTGIALPGDTNLHMDTWVRKANNVEDIRSAYVRNIIDNSADDNLIFRDYDGNSIGGPSFVNDSENEIWNGFAPAVAETFDDRPCVAFAGNLGGNAYGLFFDNEAGVVLDVAKPEIEGLVYFPNPATNEVFVKANTSIDEVVIYSVFGKEVLRLESSAQQVRLNTSSLAAGVYLIQVRSGRAQSNFKIVKE